jgi:hypothetical protein
MPGLMSTPKPAPITPPAVMPTPDDAAVQAAKKAQLAAMAQRTGRQSTMLSDYSSDKLG